MKKPTRCRLKLQREIVKKMTVLSTTDVGTVKGGGAWITEDRPCTCDETTCTNPN